MSSNSQKNRIDTFEQLFFEYLNNCSLNNSTRVLLSLGKDEDASGVGSPLLSFRGPLFHQRDVVFESLEVNWVTFALKGRQVDRHVTVIHAFRL